MENIGIIAEYNPFHNGHKYQLDKIKEQFNPTTITTIISQDTVQRGEFASFDKFFRSKIALENGADFVLGLPFYASNTSAEFFAKGSLKILNNFGVDTLVFGSESGNLKLLNETAEFLVDKEQDFIKLAKNNPKISYPRLLENFLKENSKEYNLVRQPNNVLSLEFLKDIYRNNYNITPVTIERVGSGYNDLNLSRYSSASGIRKALTYNAFTNLNDTVPYSLTLLKEHFQELNEDRLFASIFTKVNELSVDELSEIVGINESFANKLKKSIVNSSNLKELFENLKSKDNIRTGINRALLNLLSGFKKDDFNLFYSSDYNPYFRLLGFKSGKEHFLKGKTPILANISRDKKKLNDYQRKAFEYDLNIANLASLNLSLEEYNKDYIRKPIIVKRND